MADILRLSEEAIDQIAAGEVVEKPFHVVKELVENAIDAMSTSIHVEIKDGGVSLVRVTDNGNGIKHQQVELAFSRHATSKITSANDLYSLQSLGFRGEALSSISAVSRLTCMTKTSNELTGIAYELYGGHVESKQEVGVPDGTTMIVKDLFYNMPVRKKFLKSPQVEASYITELMEQLALSRPDIAFQYTVNHKVRFYTTGNGELKEVIYRIYGMNVTKELLEVDYTNGPITITGYIGKPTLTKQNRSLEHYFVNGRYLKSSVVSRAIEEGYANHLMQHAFPFTVLLIELPPDQVDINIHPSKMEAKFLQEDAIQEAIQNAITNALTVKELIPEVELTPIKNTSAPMRPVVPAPRVPEPFEVKRHEHVVAEHVEEYAQIVQETKQLDLFTPEFLTQEAKEEYVILGQLFRTYWVIGYADKVFFMDQHAAHEKVHYERLIAKIKSGTVHAQNLLIPQIVTLSASELPIYEQFYRIFEQLGFVIEPFGGKEYALRAVPMELYGEQAELIFFEVLHHLMTTSTTKDTSALLEKCASMACKAAVKGNQTMSREQVSVLLDELMTLEQPYNCPHGRPTIISMTQYELEKKFKRII